MRKLRVEDTFRARKDGSTGQICVNKHTFNVKYCCCCSDWMCLKRVRAALCTGLCCYVPLFLGASRCGCLQAERTRRHDSEHFPLRTLQLLDSPSFSFIVISQIFKLSRCVLTSRHFAPNTLQTVWIPFSFFFSSFFGGSSIY